MVDQQSPVAVVVLGPGSGMLCVVRLSPWCLVPGKDALR